MNINLWMKNKLLKWEVQNGSLTTIQMEYLQFLVEYYRDQDQEAIDQLVYQLLFSDTKALNSSKILEAWEFIKPCIQEITPDVKTA